MAIVTRVRKEWAPDHTHEHITGVCTSTGQYYYRAAVAKRIESGEIWLSSAGGKQARIRLVDHCPYTGCPASPYLTTAPDHTPVNNLEHLPSC